MNNKHGIQAARNVSDLIHRSGKTKDIIEVILSTIPGASAQTKVFSRSFSKDVKSMSRLWRWVKTNIRYKEDPPGVQWVKTPARLVEDVVGDCKSYTIFIVSVLKNLGIDYKVRFVNTERPGSENVNHVYPIAVVDGQEVIIDAVYGQFNAEHPYYYKKDYDMPDIYRLSGIGNTPTSLGLSVQEVIEAAAGIDDSVLTSGDITLLTQGEFSRWLTANRYDAMATADQTQSLRYQAAAAAVRSGDVVTISGVDARDMSLISQFISETENRIQPAFESPVLYLPENVSGVGNLFDKLADAVKNAWKKIINWLFKLAVPIAAPYFLYVFARPDQLGPKGQRRQKRQKAVLDFIQRAGKFDSNDAVVQAVRTAIIKRMGKEPEIILAEKTGIAGIGAFPVALIAQALPKVLEIIKRIASLFKKQAIDAAGGEPDENELAAEAEEIKRMKNRTPGAFLPKGGDNTMLYLLAAAGLAGGILIYNKK